MTPAFLAAFRPDPAPLLRRIAAHIDDAMLAEIAAADYGFQADENLVRLRALRKSGEMPDFNAQEVLALTRWAEPDWDNWSGPKGRRGHWMRAFACAGLLSAREDEGRWGALNDTLGQMLASFDALRAPLNEEGAAFLAWRLDAFDCGADSAFFGVGLLWFALNLHDVSDETIVTLCTWTAQEERKLVVPGAEEGRWLLSRTSGQRLHVWDGIGARIAAADTTGRSDAAREWVALIGASLAVPAD